MHKLIIGEGNYIHKNGKKYDNRKNNLVKVRNYKNDGKTLLNGYIAVYYPEHPRAFKNGCVYEHLLIAEKMLGRKLTNEECVHHIDFDKTNNAESNLMVFATQNDHIAYHNGHKAILLDNGSYKCDILQIDDHIHGYELETFEDTMDFGTVIFRKNKTSYNLCPNCRKNLKTIKAKVCSHCQQNSKGIHIPSKEILEELIKKESFVSIGKKYKVSDNAVRKWCKKYGLPYRKKDLFIDIPSSN